MRKTHYPSRLRTLLLAFFFSVSVIAFIFRVDITSAINTLLEGYRVLPGAGTTIDTSSLGGDCKVVTAPAGSDRFVPTKTLAEWNAFKSAAPGLGIGLGTCTGGSCSLTRDFIKRSGSNSSDGGSAGEVGGDIVIDSAGNTYIKGSFMGTADIFGQILISSGSTDMYVAKFNASGSLAWAKRIGGTGYERGDGGLAVDASGNIYITGNSQAGGDILGSSLPAGGFAAKIDTNGTLVWVKGGGSEGDDIAVDASGNVYVAGYFLGTSTVFGVSLSAPWQNAFLAKLDSSGNAIWVKKAGGTGQDYGVGVKVDGSGNVYFLGHFQGTGDFFGQSLTSAGVWDIFIAKVDSSGNLVWAKRAGSTGYDITKSLALDSSNNVYLGGYFDGTVNMFGQTLVSGGPGGYSDGFIVKLDTSGNLVWAKNTGGASSANDSINGIAVDSGGNVYTTGFYQGTSDIFGQTFSVVTSNIFVAKLDSSGNRLWVKSAGNGTPRNSGEAIALGPNSSVYISGYFNLLGGVGTADIFGTSLTSANDSDIFLAKLSQTDGSTMKIPFIERATSHGFGDNSATNIAVDASKNVFVAGKLTGTGDIFGTIVSPGAGGFVTRLDNKGIPQWTKTVSGPNYYDVGINRMAIDGSSNIYLIGPTTVNATVDLLGKGVQGYGAYFAKFDPSGNNIFVKSGSGINVIDMKYDPVGGNIYIVGVIHTNTANVFGQTATFTGAYNQIFVEKLDSLGNVLWYKQTGGGPNSQTVDSIAVDSAGNSYTLGYFSSGATIFGQSMTSGDTYNDIFLTKLDTNGNVLWVKQSGVTGGQDYPTNIAVGPTGLYVSGVGNNTSVFGSGVSCSAALGFCGFLARLDPANGNAIWAQMMNNLAPAPFNQDFYTFGGLNLDSSGNILMTGNFSSTANVFGQSFTASGSNDIYAVKLDANGNRIWAKVGGGPIGYDIMSNPIIETGYDITSDTSGDVYVVGKFQLVANVFGQILYGNVPAFVFSGNGDAFVAQLSGTDGTPLCK